MYTKYLKAGSLHFPNSFDEFVIVEINSDHCLHSNKHLFAVMGKQFCFSSGRNTICKYVLFGDLAKEPVGRYVVLIFAVNRV